MSWKFPIFSFLKKLSGCQTLPTSVSVKYLILSVSESLCQGTREEMYLHRASVWTAIGDRSTFASVLFGIYIPRDKNYNNRRKLDWFITILTSSISENPRTKIFTKMSVAASRIVHINSLENDIMKLTGLFTVWLCKLTSFPGPSWGVSATEYLLQFWLRVFSLRSDSVVVSFRAENVINNFLLHGPDVDLRGRSDESEGE